MSLVPRHSVSLSHFEPSNHVNKTANELVSPFSRFSAFSALIAQFAVIQHFRGVASCELTGFAAAIMTLAKTVLYAFVELASSGRHTLHTNWFDLIFLYYLPNYLWIAFPAAIVYTLGGRIVALYASKQASADKKAK